MIQWHWTRQETQPEDVLDAAMNISVRSNRVTINLTSNWVEAERYLSWAIGVLRRGGDDAWDSAVGWAKRAVCRQMDGILTHNHLGCFLRGNYAVKAGYLANLNVPGLNILRETILDPRNEIEHAYWLATEKDARRACEVAELFLMATQKEAAIPAIAALGWNIGYRGQSCSKPGQEYERHEYSLKNYQSPMLLIDGYAAEPEVLVLYPKEELLSVCRCESFTSAQMMKLNARLRECLKTVNYSARHITQEQMKIVRDQLRL